MKKLPVLLVIMYLNLFPCSWAQPSIQWQRCIGGTSSESARSIIQSVHGGYLLAGWTSSNDGNVSGNHGSGSGDFWVIKLDTAGQIVWQECFGGTTWEIANSAQQTADGGYIITGYTDSNDGDVVGHFGERDFWIVKLNSAGVFQWQKCFGGAVWDEAYSIQQVADWGFILAGVTESNDGDVSGSHGFQDCWIIKIDSVGYLEWQTCLGGTVEEGAHSIQQTTDGGYIVAGVVGSNDGDVSGNHGWYDGWLVKITSTGLIDWQFCLGGSGSDGARSTQQTADGGYVLAGYTDSNDGDVSGNHGQYDAWVIKLDSTGVLEWQKCLGGTDHDVACTIQQTDEGGYIVAGTSLSTDGDVIGSHGGNEAWVVKLNSTGDLEWQKCLGGSDSDDAYSIQETVDGGYILAGGTSSNDGDVSGNHGDYDAWVVKLSSISTGFNDIFPFITELSIYPNPAADNLVIDCGTNYAGLNGYSIRITNLLGQTVYNSPVTAQITNIQLTPPTWVNGTYVVQFVHPNGTVMETKRIIIQ